MVFTWLDVTPYRIGQTTQRSFARLIWLHDADWGVNSVRAALIVQQYVHKSLAL